MIFPLGWFPRLIFFFWPFAFLYWNHFVWAVFAEMAWIALLCAIAEVNKNWGRKSRIKALEEARVRDLGLHSKPAVPDDYELPPAQGRHQELRGKHHRPPSVPYTPPVTPPGHALPPDEGYRLL